MGLMYSLKNLRRRSGRTILTILGISLAISLTVTMFSIGEGIRESAKEYIEDTGIDLIVVRGNTSFIYVSSVMPDGREKAQSITDGNPDVSHASPVLKAEMYITSLDENYPTSTPKVTSFQGWGKVPELHAPFTGREVIRGTDLTVQEDPFYLDPFYESGTLAQAAESSNFTREILLQEDLARFLDADVGSRVQISKNSPSTSTQLDLWLENTTWFEVVGITRVSLLDEGFLSGMMHLSELQFLSDNNKIDGASFIDLKLADGASDREVKVWLDEEWRYRSVTSVYTQDDILETIDSLLSTFSGFSQLIITITFATALLFISTIMMISVRERAGEIMALRAIGFGKSSIFTNILAESVMLSLIGLALGLAMGVAASSVLDTVLRGITSGVPPDFRITRTTPLLIFYSSAIALLIGIVSSLIPAAWVYRLNIADTLRKERR